MLQKLLLWIPRNLAGLLGVAQAVIKAGKEISTVLVNIVSPLIPESKFAKVITTIRNVFNKLDSIAEKIKGFFLSVGASQ